MHCSRRQWIVALPLLLGACHRAAGAAAAAVEAELPTVTPEQLATRIANHENIAVYDNNSHDSYLSGHVPGARWVAFNNVQASDLPSRSQYTTRVLLPQRDNRMACHTAARQAVALGLHARCRHARGNCRVGLAGGRIRRYTGPIPV